MVIRANSVNWKCLLKMWQESCILYLKWNKAH